MVPIYKKLKNSLFLSITNEKQFIILCYAAYHSRGGNLPISESRVSPLPDVYSRSAKELGMKTVDLNGEDMIGKFFFCKQEQWLTRHR